MEAEVLVSQAQAGGGRRASEAASRWGPALN